MDKLEKVIQALENCTAEIKCRDCPWDECEGQHEHVELPKGLALKTLELLKAQEPRVMTLEELKSYLGKPVWIEEKGCEPYCEVVFDVDGVCFGLTKGEVEVGGVITGHAMFAVGGYGSIFRAWTEEPTDEQREAVKWDG